jgi:putative Mn2+ efflux pump MntP
LGEGLLLTRLFRNHHLGSLFSIGVLATFIVGLLLESVLIRAPTLISTIVAATIIGSVGSVMLFGMLKILERRMKRR